MVNSIVKVEHLYHRYATQWAIQDISFEIKQTGVVGLLGSNGAGKSTTMNIICGVLKQTSGEVYIDGINSLKDPIAARRNIGFLPQKPPLYPDLTVEEYLRFCAEIHLVEPKDVKDAVGEVLEECDIAHFRKRLLCNLSGGYQQRVSIAQAILHKPKLVILDEPTNGLDPNQILEVRHLIRNIAKERTVMLSTHILSEIQAVCDSIIMIEHGQVVFSGKMMEFDNYVEPNSLLIHCDHLPRPDEMATIRGIRNSEILGKHTVRLFYDGESDTIKRVIRESLDYDWGLTEIQKEKSSIEEIFARLSGKNK